MKNLKNSILNLMLNVKGQDLVEYALMAGFVAVAAGAIMPNVATSISTIFSSIASVMTGAALVVPCKTIARVAKQIPANEVPRRIVRIKGKERWNICCGCFLHFQRRICPIAFGICQHLSCFKGIRTGPAGQVYYFNRVEAQRNVSELVVAAAMGSHVQVIGRME